ncbi:MAG: dockerin type I repeat-containing protein, partial [Euryarchaeota archaeon]|nr:dockerin type I repeat-containing protein [Euryarchaeota archaeon]
LILTLTLTSASVQAYTGSESGYHIKLVTPHEFSNMSSEDAYKMSFAVGTGTSGLLRTEGDYTVGLNIYTTGIGGEYNEDGYELYLVPDRAFVSYRCGITANDPEEYPCGDVNHDCMVTPADAVIALNLAASGEYNRDADVNNDCKVTSLDALMILQVAV